MLSFNFHLGDWIKATQHLTRVERDVYLALLIRYYDTETALPCEPDQVYRLAMAKDPDERKAVDVVLAEFFDLEPDGWHNKRADLEVAQFHEKSEKARQSAYARHRGSTDVMRTHSERTANARQTQSERNADGMLTTYHIPITNNHKEKPSLPPKGADVVEVPDSIDAEAWEAFATHRQQIKKKLTPLAARKQLDFLRQYDKPTQRAIVDQTVRNGWTGLFEPKGGNQHANNPEQDRVRQLQRSAVGRVQLAIEREQRERQGVGSGNGPALVVDDGQDLRPPLDVGIQ